MLHVGIINKKAQESPLCSRIDEIIGILKGIPSDKPTKIMAKKSKTKEDETKKVVANCDLRRFEVTKCDIKSETILGLLK